MFALLAGAGIAAGLTGSIAGLASLFSYPALLAAGLPATAANVTNTVSLAVGSLSTITSSRPDLVGQAGIARRLGLICAAGGAAGASLLLVTPSGLFARIVPFLVAAASVLMLLGRRAPVAMGERHAEGPRRRRPGVLVGVLAVSVPLTIGLLLGSWFGPPVVRRLPANLLRIGIGLAGLGLAVKLALDTFF
jgi:hypothetical protein